MIERYFFKQEDDLVKFIKDRVKTQTNLRVHKLIYILSEHYREELSGDESLPKELVKVDYRIGKQGLFVPTVVLKEKEGYYDKERFKKYVKAETGFEQRVYRELGKAIEHYNTMSDMSLVSIVKDLTNWEEEQVGLVYKDTGTYVVIAEEEKIRMLEKGLRLVKEKDRLNRWVKYRI